MACFHLIGYRSPHLFCGSSSELQHTLQRMEHPFRRREHQIALWGTSICTVGNRMCPCLFLMQSADRASNCGGGALYCTPMRSKAVTTSTARVFHAMWIRQVLASKAISAAAEEVPLNHSCISVVVGPSYRTLNVFDDTRCIFRGLYIKRLIH